MSKTLKRILYVDDEQDIRTVAQIALETVGGFELCVCASGEEALARAEAFAPDLLLLDVMMPGMDGPETLRALRQIPALQDTPAIFMTAKVQPQEVAYYMRIGALEVIAKPFEAMRLGQQIQDCWSEKMT